MTSDSPFPPGSQVVAYLRDSGGTDQDLSVDQQENAVRAWCLDAGLELTRVFHDDARPGSSVVGRDQFLQMISYFHRGSPPERGVILWKYSRFSRDIDDAQFYKADLRRMGYVIHSITDQIPEGIDGRFYESALDWMNNRFLLDLSSDVKRGLHHNFEQYGALPGTPPRGFKRETIQLGQRRDGSAHQVARWVPDPETWDRCKLAWKLRAAGATYRQINDRTHLYKSINGFKTFFINRLYLGEMKFGETIVAGYVDPMVDQETWDAVQRINHRNQLELSTRSGNLRHPRRLGSSFLLSGLAHCARCGAPLNGNVIHFSHDHQEFDYYLCSRAGQTHECNAKRIPRQALETAIMKTLRDFILDPDISAQRQQDLLNGQEDRKHELEVQLADLQSQLKKITREIGNINDVIAEEGKNTPRSTRDRLASAERDELVLRARITNLRDTMRSDISVMTPEQARQISTRLQKAIDTEGPENLKIMLSGIIRRICAERDGNLVRGMVYFYHPPEIKTPPPGSGGGVGEADNLCVRGSASTETPDIRIKKIYSIEFTYPIKP